MGSSRRCFIPADVPQAVFDMQVTLVLKNSNHSYNIILTIRWKSSSWASPSGIILMGGDVSDKTTEQIQEDGTSTYSFALKHALRLF